MPPRLHLNLVDRGRVLAWVQEGIRLREIAARLGCSHSIIVRLRQRFLATGSVETRPRSGRPRSTTQRQYRYITRQALQTRTTTASTIRRRLGVATNTASTIRRRLGVATNTDINEQTVRSRLHDQTLHARRQLGRILLTPRHMMARLAWSTRHLRWNRQQWAQVLFSDESRFSLEHDPWMREGVKSLPGRVSDGVGWDQRYAASDWAPCSAT
ncbi:hypothetical protein V1264_008987 [Littorina saxatilis]|uniref:Transposase Tc1-like domain-containing protein n=1 Tax=Littorina saxatilis TaxID=31220 RepID=A0AAN9AQH2_9CAEN